jgi:purine-binding chemotaxis protein CheW
MAQDIVTTGSREVGSILDEDKDDFVISEGGNQLFRIPVLKVQDIPKLETIASIPLAPNRVKGSINLPGRIVTVVSVRVCLGIGERDRARG